MFTSAHPSNMQSDTWDLAYREQRAIGEVPGVGLHVRRMRGGEHDAVELDGEGVEAGARLARPAQRREHQVDAASRFVVAARRGVDAGERAAARGGRALQPVGAE